METCILMPPELSLILLPHPDPAKIFEMSVTLWSNCTLRPGKVFRPDDGKMTLDKLEVYGVLPLKDTRYMFGCTDAIIEVDDREVRHCNWVRFLRVAQNPDDVNIIGSRVQGQFVFQVIKTIPPNGELKAYLDIGPKIHGKSKIIRHITIRGNDEKENLLISPTGSTSTHSTSGSPQSDDFDDDRRSTPSSDISPSTTTTTNTSKSKVSESDFLSTPGGKSGKSTDNFLSASGSSPFTSPPFPDGKRFCHSPIIGSGPGYQVPLLALPEFKDARVTPLRRKEKTWLPCEVCGKKFDRPSLLKRHMRTHTGEKPHACDVCGKAFSTSSSLNTHRRIHSGEKPHQCQVCGKRFTASSNLYYHRMTHKKEKPHKCSMCSKSFPTPGDLKSHMYIHNGSWPFKCDVCNRGFSKQTNLKNHLLLHTGDKPHECELCGKKFALQCNLRTHVKTHEDEPRDNCIRCKRKFLSHWGHQSTCSDCMTSSDPQTPTANSGRPSNSFSIESLVSPRTESRDKRMDYAHAQSTPIDLSKTPFYANAMMTSGLVPMYRHHFDGTATAAHFTMATNWPRPPPQITQRYGM